MEKSIHELLMKLEADLLEKVPLAEWTNAPRAILMVAEILSHYLREIIVVMVDVFNDAVFAAKKERKQAGMKGMRAAGSAGFSPVQVRCSCAPACTMTPGGEST